MCARNSIGLILPDDRHSFIDRVSFSFMSLGTRTQVREISTGI